MSTPVKMPQLGESVVEGTVARWLKTPGQPVTKLEPLLEITTDKIDAEVPAPIGGTLLQILVPAGTTVAAGAVLGYIGVEGAPLPVAGMADPAPDAAGRALSPGQPRTVRPRPAGRDFVSPVVARMAGEQGVDLAQVAGSGMGGRVTKQDMLAFIAAHPEEPARAEPPTPTTGAGADDDEVLLPLTSMRRAIAQHMALSQQTSAHVTTVFEVDMTAVVQHRESHKAGFEAKGVRLTFTPYFVAAAVAGLRAVPEANGRYGDEGIRISRRIHVGVAVSLDNGLIVPVIRDADEKNLLGLARSVGDLAARARSNQLAPDEVRGGTFTLTNHGVGGSLLATPIIHQPQSGILGIGTIAKRAVVRSGGASLLPSAEDAIVIRPMGYLSFSFDHRVLDGARADLFVSAVKQALEDWIDSE